MQFLFPTISIVRITLFSLLYTIRICTDSKVDLHFITFQGRFYINDG